MKCRSLTHTEACGSRPATKSSLTAPDERPISSLIGNEQPSSKRRVGGSNSLSPPLSHSRFERRGQLLELRPGTGDLLLCGQSGEAGRRRVNRMIRVEDRDPD